MKKQMMKFTYTMMAAGCLLTVTACGTEPVKPDDKVTLEQTQGLEGGHVSPIEMRKFINFNGYRYAVINEELDTTMMIGNEIGQLNKLLSEENDFEGAGEDLTSTFSEDGKIYEINGYNPAYRVVVQTGGNYYLCEVVAKSDDTDMDIKQYFEVANFEELATKVEIYSQIEGNHLATLTEDDLQLFLQTLKAAQPIKMTAQDYEAKAEAQVNGKSFMIKLVLNDGTYTTFNISPELNFVSIGDYPCYNAELNEKIGHLFANLVQETTDVVYE